MIVRSRPVVYHHHNVRIVLLKIQTDASQMAHESDNKMSLPVRRYQTNRKRCLIQSNNRSIRKRAQVLPCSQ